MDKSKEESKRRILESAARVFAEKTYSGARMEEIAANARVNKALIYYYFKSKETILNELFQKFFRESTDLLLRFVERGGFKGNAEENKRLFEAEYAGYLEANGDLLKILVIESLKGDAKDAPLFRLVDLEGSEHEKRIQGIEERTKLSEKERNRMVVTEFFTGVMPFVAYIVLKEKWCTHFKMSEKELKECFDYAMANTHEQYHLKGKGKGW